MVAIQRTHEKLWAPLLHLPGRRDLIFSLTRRELAARYRGSFLGLLWVIITPLVLIAIFTMVFAGMFGARFGPTGSAWDYALYMFCGLLPWTAFQETLQQSSATIVSHSNLVKRVVFPLETLPISLTFCALLHQLFGTVALLVAAIIIEGRIHPTILWLPVLLLPQMIATMGGAWLVSSLGVYIRDVSQGIGLFLMVWLYLTPIIYPESAAPAGLRRVLHWNPFTGLVRCYRDVLLDGRAPDWRGLAYFSLFAMVMFIFGYWWFAKTRKGFADVL
jgi:lipopolysaccharide transport system permease protein